MPRSARALWQIDDCEVLISRRKRMKYLRISVHPPEGEVRVSAPWHASNREIESFIRERMSWVADQQRWCQSLPKPQKPEFVSGETVKLWGRDLPLVLEEGNRRRAQTQLLEESLVLQAPMESTVEQREKYLDRFFRKVLEEKALPLLDFWQAELGVHMQAWGIKKMRTRWGSCNASDARIWLNLELVHHPEECLRYVCLHELAHLIEANHSRRFWDIVERHMPNWKSAAAILKKH